MPFHWLLATLVAVALGSAASAWLWLDLRRRHEADTGLAALGAMRWREFSRFVLDAMRHRGYDVEGDGQALAGAQQTDFVLQRGGKRALLACRHGADARVDARLVHALENALLANGATAGVVATTGHVEPGARASLAAQPKLELLSGRRLWRELKPLLPETVRDEASDAARRHAAGRIRLSWLGAIAIGIVVGLVARGAYAPAPLDPPPVAAPSMPAPAVPVPADPIAETPPPAPQPAPAAPQDPPTGEAAFDRSQVTLAVAALPGVRDAAWASESTLLVSLDGDADDVLPDICGILEQYEALRASRLQLQPPPGSTQRVRFRQCRVF